MTSREHARRLMLILLSSDGRPGGRAGAEAGGIDRDERPEPDGDTDGDAAPDDRHGTGLVAGLTRM